MFREKIFSYFNGDREAVRHIDSKVSLNYIELGETIAGIADYLKAQGLKEQSKLALYAENNLETSLIYIACLYAGIIICPLNPKISEEENEYCLGLLKADLVLKNLPKDFLKDIEKKKPSPQSYNADDVFTITFTSGSTGTPKAIVHKAEILLANADAMNRFTDCDENTRMFHVMPIYYMAGILNSLLGPLVAGGTLILAENFAPLSPMSFCQKWLDNQANTTWLSPTMVNALINLDRNEEARAELRKSAGEFKIFCATAPLRLETKEQFKEKYNIALLESYGLSEILFVSVKDTKQNTFNKSVGKLIDGVECNIINGGELEFVTKYPMVGYLQKDGSTYGIDGDKFRSGDIGEIINGELFITGRIKDLIIKGGINISPRQIEEKLEKLEGVKQVAIVGYPDNFYGENIACFVAGEISEAELKKYCTENLEAHKVPAKFVILESLPVGPTGKIQKDKLKL